MKKLSYDEMPENRARVDWDGPPHEVLEAVDEQLRPLGYEVVCYGDEDWMWTIERRDD